VHPADHIVEHAHDARVVGQAQFMRGLGADGVGRLRRLAQCQRIGRAEEPAVVVHVKAVEPLLAARADVVDLLAGEAHLALPVEHLEVLLVAARNELHRLAIPGADQRLSDRRARRRQRQRFDLVELNRLALRDQIAARQADEVRRLRPQRHAAAARLDERVDPAVDAPHLVAVTLFDNAGDAQAEDALDDRHVDGRVQVVGAEIVDRAHHVSARLIQVGPARGDGDRAGRRRTPAQRTLRTAQHFDLLDIEHRLEQDARRKRRVVQVEFDRAVVAARVHVIGDAAQGGLGADAVGAAGQLEAWDQALDLLEFAQVQLVDVLGRDRVHDQRHVLLRFPAAARLNDDHVVPIGCIVGAGGNPVKIPRSRILRERRSGHAEEADASQRERTNKLHENTSPGDR
jgi:hypothetical protein